MIKAVKFLRNQACLCHVQCTLKLLLRSSANLKKCKIQIGRTVIDNYSAFLRLNITV